MDGRLVLGMLLLGACKAELADGPVDGNGVDGNGIKFPDGSGSDGQTLGVWGTPAAIPGGNTAVDEDDATLSSTALEIYFKRIDTDANLYVMTRQTTSSQWSNPSPLTVLNSTVDEESPRLSPDDLTLYFGRNGDIYKSVRTTVGSPWGAAAAVTSLNTAAYEKWGIACANGYAMVSRAVTGQGQDIFDGTLATGTNNPVGVLNTASAEQGMFLTGDCLTLYFQSNRDNAQFNIYTATRTSQNDPWTSPTAMSYFNTATFNEEDPWVASDERTFVYTNNSGGNKDLYISTR